MDDFLKDLASQVKLRISNSVLVCFFITWLFVNRQVLLYWFFSEDPYSVKLKEISNYHFDWFTDIIWPMFGVIFYLFLVPIVTVAVQFAKSKYDDHFVNKFEDAQYKKLLFRERKRQRSEQIFKRVMENEISNRELRKAAAIENKLRLINEKTSAIQAHKRSLEEELNTQKALAQQYLETSERFKNAKSAEHLETVRERLLNSVVKVEKSLAADDLHKQVSYVPIPCSNLNEVLTEGLKSITISIRLLGGSTLDGPKDHKMEIPLHECNKDQLNAVSKIFSDTIFNSPVHLSNEQLNEFLTFNFKSAGVRSFRAVKGVKHLSATAAVVEVKEPFLSYFPIKQLVSDLYHTMDLVRQDLDILKSELEK